MLELLEAIVAAVNADGIITTLIPGGFHLHEVPPSKELPFAYIESASSGKPNYNTGTIYVEDVTVDVIVEGAPKAALRAGVAIRQKFEDEGLTLSAGRKLRCSVDGADFNNEGDDNEEGEQVSTYGLSLVFKQQQEED